MLQISTKFLCYSTLKKRIQRYTALTFTCLVVMCFGSDDSSNDPYAVNSKTADENLFLQLRVWLREFSKHAVRTGAVHDDLVESDANNPHWSEQEVAEYKSNKRNIENKYRFLLFKWITPHLIEFSKKWRVDAVSTQQKKSGWEVTFAWVKTIIKLGVGIAKLDDGRTCDCFKEITELLHGAEQVLDVAKKSKIGVPMRWLIKQFQSNKMKFFSDKLILKEEHVQAFGKMRSELMEINDTTEDLSKTQVSALEELQEAVSLQIPVIINKCQKAIAALQKEQHPKNVKTYKIVFYKMMEKSFEKLCWPAGRKSAIFMLKKRLTQMEKENTVYKEKLDKWERLMNNPKIKELLNMNDKDQNKFSDPLVEEMLALHDRLEDSGKLEDLTDKQVAEIVESVMGSDC